MERRNDPLSLANRRLRQAERARIAEEEEQESGAGRAALWLCLAALAVFAAGFVYFELSSGSTAGQRANAPAYTDD